jgi:thiamine kinase-like enzyme
VAVWQDVARWLARLHLHFSKREGWLGLAPLLDYERDTFAGLLAALDDGDAPHRALVGLIEPLWPKVLAAAFAGTSTLLHGDFHASNILVRPSTPASVWVVDWEMAGFGPGLLDLAALTAGWPEVERNSIASAYRDTLELDGRAYADFVASFESARLLTCLHWLTAPRCWHPPEAHRTDWLNAAFEIARKLGSLGSP